MGVNRLRLQRIVMRHLGPTGEQWVNFQVTKAGIKETETASNEELEALIEQMVESVKLLIGQDKATAMRGELRATL